MLTQKQVDQFNKFFSFSVEVTAFQEIKPKAETQNHNFKVCKPYNIERQDRELCFLETKQNKNGSATFIFEEVRNPEQLLNDIVLLLSHVNDEDRAFEILNDDDSILYKLDY